MKGNSIDILTDERTILVYGNLPVDYIEFEDLIVVSLVYFKKVINMEDRDIK